MSKLRASEVDDCLSRLRTDLGRLWMHYQEFRADDYDPTVGIILDHLDRMDTALYNAEQLISKRRIEAQDMWG